MEQSVDAENGREAAERSGASPTDATQIDEVGPEEERRRSSVTAAERQRSERNPNRARWATPAPPQAAHSQHSSATGVTQTDEVGSPGGGADVTPWRTRVFGSRPFFRLWCAQVVQATGDWIGFLAIAAAAARVGGGSPETAIGLVMSARIVPGFFLAPLGGVLVDRWDRKKTMVACNLLRVAVVAFLPFITAVWQLLVASVFLEVLTLLWSLAKEASVPNLVPADRLTHANSLSLAAAYGTFPFASALFALLATLAARLSDVGAIDWLELSQESLAFWFYGVTFLVSALLIAGLTLPKPTRRTTGAAGHDSDDSDRRLGAGIFQAGRDLRDGWRFIVANPVVRAVHLGLATGLIGGAMVVPLGPVFSDQVLGSGTAGFGVLTTALGVGVAGGVLLLSVLQKRVKKTRVFVAAVLVAGGGLLWAASMTTLWAAAAGIAVVGVCGGSVYVLGFTLLHESVEDQFRGRIFSALITVVRLCVLIAFALAPLLTGLLDGLSNRWFDDRRLDLFGLEVFVPGVRLTLWLAGIIILGAGLLTRRTLRAEHRDSEPESEATPVPHP